MLTQERRPNSEPSMPPPTVVRLYSGELYVFDERTRMGLIFPLMTPLIC